MNKKNSINQSPKINRRHFLIASATATVSLAMGSIFRTAQAASSYSLPPLPYADNALEPVISAKTISFHWGKHHRGYMNKLNKLIAGTEYADMTLEKIIMSTAGKAEKTAIFNSAAQFWNHTFYWQSLTPIGGGEPPTEHKQKIEASSGPVRPSKQELMSMAVPQFGCGRVPV